jgi:hypothetical protein
MGQQQESRQKQQTPFHKTVVILHTYLTCSNR